MEDVRLPEFDRNRSIEEKRALVFDGHCRYDVILGSDFLEKAGIDIKYTSKTVEWLGLSIPLRDPHRLSDDDYNAMQATYQIDIEDEFMGEETLDVFVNEILDAKYDKIDIKDVITQQTHLTETQRESLYKVLSKHSKLFDGTLGVYPHKKFHIELEPGAEPVHHRGYPVPYVHRDVFKRELDHLVKLGVLVRAGSSEWASPTFIQPKKCGRVRWVSDLRALNKVIKRRKYPLPIIHEVLRRRKGYKFFSKLDISMQYYTFELDDDSQDLCTIQTPFGLYKYTRLPMGLKCSPDWAQETMERVLHLLDDIETYIDDIGVFSNTWERHVELLDKVLTRLEDNGFTINPLKCEWGVKETDWLGYWLTPIGLKPWKKKIDTILKMDRPRRLKDLRMFIGAVNYYRDMWPSRSHILTPLTDKTGVKKFVWTDEMDKAFLKMKALLATDAMTAYPNHNKPFKIYTDASDYQLGAIIVQEDDNGQERAVAYYSRKLNTAQKNYSTMDKELLSIVMTLKEFRTMLLGAELHIYTDHKNLTFENLSSQRVQRWRCYIDDYGPTLHYIEGSKNIMADTFSRLHRVDDRTDSELDINEDDIESEERPKLRSLNTETVGRHSQQGFDVHYTSIFDDTEILDCLLNLPDMNDPTANPLNYQYIHDQQEADNGIQKMKQKFPDSYITKQLDGNIDITCYVKPGSDKDTEWKIALPENMIADTIKFFHEIMGHPGSTRLRETIGKRYFHPRLRHFVDRYKCDHCQRHKLDGPGYGLLPEREQRESPWDEVAVDLIGPWKLEVNGQEVEFNALTCIDPVTNLAELIRVNKANPTSRHVARKFEQAWLCRYPKPIRCVHDRGSEFKLDFQLLLEKLHIKSVQCTSKNPQSNAICERMHQSVGNILRTMLYSKPTTLDEANDIIDDALATVTHALRVCTATALGSPPGSLVFGRDMFLNVPLVADWHTIASRREQTINEQLRRQNARRRQYDYQPGERILKKVYKPTKLGHRTEGPYTIDKTHVNGTVTFRRTPTVRERINVRRIIPYHTPTV